AGPVLEEAAAPAEEETGAAQLREDRRQVHPGSGVDPQRGLGGRGRGRERREREVRLPGPEHLDARRQYGFISRVAQAVVAREDDPVPHTRRRSARGPFFTCKRSQRATRTVPRSAPIQRPLKVRISVTLIGVWRWQKELSIPTWPMMPISSSGKAQRRHFGSA